MSLSDTHFHNCLRGRDCPSCHPAYAVNAGGEHPSQTFGHVSGAQYAQVPPALDTAGPPNTSTFMSHRQAHASPNAPPPFWVSQALDPPGAPATQMQAYSAAAAGYNHFAPPTATPAYTSYPPSFNNPQWESVNGANASASQGTQIAPIMAPTIESTRIDAVPGEKRVYEFVTRGRF